MVKYITEVASDIMVLRTHRGPFISDHAAVIAQLNIKKFMGARQSKMVRVLKDIIADQWIAEYQNQDLQLSDDFDEMVTKLNSTLKAVLDNLALERKIHRSLGPKCPWYTSDP